MSDKFLSFASNIYRPFKKNKNKNKNNHIVSELEHLSHLAIPLKEIKLATNNFSDENLIRDDGFSWKDYRGELSHYQGQITVIVRRLNSQHVHEHDEFLTQLQMLSSYKHENLVSLVGYSDEDRENIVVLKYVEHGGLDNYIGTTSITWMERIRICLGVARGLNYLHNDVGTQHRVLHRDIKCRNILLDKNWEPRITGFEVSRIGPANQQYTHLNTIIAGTLGYLDPTYMKTGVLTKESDIYSLGVVLFEVLCARKVFDVQYEDHRRHLATYAKHCYEKQQLNGLIDPILRKQMDPTSFSMFSGIAYQCLNDNRENRPKVSLILETLEKVLEFQRMHENLLRLQVVGGLKEDAKDNYYKVKGLDHLKVPLEDIKAATGDFDAHNAIGRGGFGTVYIAELFHFDVKNSLKESTGELSRALRKKTTVAIKRLDPTSLQGKTEFLQEVSLLSNYRHPNIINLVGFCDEDGENILIYEYASNRSLDRYFHVTSKTLGKTWAQRLQICIDVANGINYLHNDVGEHLRIIHRDVKCSNILLDQTWQAKICDFGLSRLVQSKMVATFVMTNVAGTPNYIDPQYWKTGRLTKESDVYSFGVVLVEVLCGRLSVLSKSNDDRDFLPDIAKRCFKEKTLYDIIDPTLKKEIKKSFSGLDNGTLPESVEIFASIANNCLQENQSDRPTIAEVVKELEKAKKCHVKGVEALRMSLDKITFATSNFSAENFIGEGGFSKLYKGKLSHSKGHGLVAIKRLNYKVGLYGEGEFFEDITKLFSYNHENVIPVLGFCEEANERIIVYELAFHGSLDKHLTRSSLTWRQRLEICVGIAHGLEHVHGSLEPLNRVHGDIKSSNILLSHDWKATITDFLLSKGAGTLGYLDPQYLTTGILTKESDVYSFGVVLFELLSRRMAIAGEFNDKRRSLVNFVLHCFEHNKLEQIIYQDMKEQAQQSSIDTFAAIAYQCILKNREDRPLIAQVVKELEKALKFQDEWEWEQKLPTDYKKVLQLSKSHISSNITRKELHYLLSSGILLKDNVWVSIRADGAKSEMVSSTKFSYNDSPVKWTSLRQSRFLKVAKILDISSLNIQIQIKTQFLTQKKMYGAHLVFKFCERRKISSRPLYVNLKYKKDGETLNAYFAEWRVGNKWLTIELYRFFNNSPTTDFEVLLETFSRYYCGSGDIFVEGIEFRPISVDAKVCKETHDEMNTSKSQPDKHWMGQLANDYEDIIRRSVYDVQNYSKEELYSLLLEGVLIDRGEKLFSVSKVNMKKCHMVPAKAVIYASSNLKFCHRKHPIQSRFAQVIELLSHYEFRMKYNIETRMLSPNTKYACFLVFQISDKCRGLECPVKQRDLLRSKSEETNIISFRSPSLVNLQYIKWIPKQREDGWMEVTVWEPIINDEHSEKYIPMDLKLTSFEGSLSGLIICGIEFRPI